MSTAAAAEIVTITSADRKVEIREDALRKAGWIREDEIAEWECGGTHYDDAAPLLRVMEGWHDEHHTGVFRFCYEQPCKDLRGVTG